MSSTSSQLPAHFERELDSKGRAYYVNHKTRKTSWLNPVKLAEFQSQGLPVSDPLVSHPYERRVAEDGHPYYINHETKSTSWVPPNAAIASAPAVDGDEDRWVVEEKAEAPCEGELYYVDYRTGNIGPQSPEDKRMAREAIQRKKEREMAPKV
jgi:hypothetical protein